MQAHVGEIRGKGLMCVEFVKDRRTKVSFALEEQVGSFAPSRFAGAVQPRPWQRVRAGAAVRDAE
jgi:adenosylmethionine-8-amino-7-oxononanoate aminotransferase